MTIKIDLTENGFIDIDVTHEDAIAMAAPFWSPRSATKAAMLALTVAEGEDLKRVRLMGKRGLSNAGWTATFIDKAKNDRYIASYRERNQPV